MMGRSEKDIEEGGYKVNELKMDCRRVVKALYYGPVKPSFNRKSRSKRMCYKCDACNLELDCGKCDFCLDQRKFGGKSLLRQKCRMRQCTLFSRYSRQGWSCGSQDVLDDYEHWEQERRKMCKRIKLKLLLRSRQPNPLMPSNANPARFGNQPQHLSLSWRRSQDELNEDECKRKRTKRELPNRPQTTLKAPSKDTCKPLQSSRKHLHHHWTSRSQKELDEERKERRRENKRRWRMKQKLLLQSRQTKQRFPRKASHPSLKTPPQVVLNGKFKVKQLQVGGKQITFCDLFVKLQNLTESMKDQALNKKARYLQVGGQRIRLRDPFVQLQNMKNMKDRALNKKTSQAPPLPLSTDDSQEGEESHPVDSESMNVTPQAPPSPLSTDISQEGVGSHPAESECVTVVPIDCPLNLSTQPLEGKESQFAADRITGVPIDCPLNLSTRPLEGKESQLAADRVTGVPIDCPLNLSTQPLEGKESQLAADSVTGAPMRDPLEGERLLPEDKEGGTMVLKSCPLPLRIEPPQGEGSNPADTEGMTTVKSPSLVLATVFYKKMEIRKRKYRIFTIKELIETCNEELDYYVQDNHDELERIQIYDTDFSDYVDVDINTDEVKDKDRFMIYFRESKCQCEACTNCSQVQVTESSNVYPSKQRQPPPLDIDDYLIQGKEEAERDSRMPVIMEIVSLGSCLAVSRRRNAPQPHWRT